MSRPITQALLADLFTGFKTSFRGGFDGAKPAYERVATVVKSNAAIENYSWLGEWPTIREWVGDRVIKQLGAYKYQVENKDFETTVAVKANHIKDDQLGLYAPMFQELGRAVRVFPDQLVFAEALAKGHQQPCYDGQYFFDTDHPVGPEGAQVPVSNDLGGGGAAWFLLDTSRALKPLIFQDREPFELTGLDKPTDRDVFMRKEFIYGSDGRCNAAFGFWQMAVRSKQTLDATNYAAARAAMGAFKSDEGRPLGVMGDLLCFGPSNEGAARQLLNAETIGGTTNPWRGTAEPLLCPWLA